VTPEDAERVYFTGRDGRRVGRLNGTQCFATAVKGDPLGQGTTTRRAAKPEAQQQREGTA